MEQGHIAIRWYQLRWGWGLKDGILDRLDLRSSDEQRLGRLVLSAVVLLLVAKRCMSPSYGFRRAGSNCSGVTSMRRLEITGL